MVGPKSVAVLVIVVMSVLMLNILKHDGFSHGIGLDTFMAGTASPWQAFINQDLVSGLLITLTWLIARQRGARGADTVAWVWLALWWGNIVIATYVLVACMQSGGDLARLLLGQRGGALRPVWYPSTPLRLICLGAAIAFCAITVVGVARAQGAVISILGYLLAFPPLILAAVLLGMPARQPSPLLAS